MAMRGYGNGNGWHTAGAVFVNTNDLSFEKACRSPPPNLTRRSLGTHLSIMMRDPLLCLERQLTPMSQSLRVWHGRVNLGSHDQKYQ